jgi:hypothetical protein
LSFVSQTLWFISERKKTQRNTKKRKKQKKGKEKKKKNDYKLTHPQSWGLLRFIDQNNL